MEEVSSDEVSCPKLDDALTMIQHGNAQAMLVHLQCLLEKTLPLFRLANERLEVEMPLEQIEQQIKSLTQAGE